MAPTGKDKSLLRACFASADGPPVADRGRWLGVGEEWIVFSQVDFPLPPERVCLVRWEEGGVRPGCRPGQCSVVLSLMRGVKGGGHIQQIWES